MNGNGTTFTIELQKELDNLRQNFLASAPPGVAAALERSADEIIRSGIMGRVAPRGATAPDFTLPNAVGREIRLSTVLARGPIVLTFYRGAW